MKHIAAVLLSLAATQFLGAQEQSPLALLSSISLPGVKGRFDHAALDAATNRLFFAALGNDTLEVVDVGSGKRLHTITGLSKPTGVAFLPDAKLLVVANGGDGTCRFFDGASYVEKGRATGLDDADNVRFDPRGNRIYLGYGEGALGVIDPATMKVTASIPLPEHPESFQLEQVGPRIFVNVPDARQVAVIDRQQLAVIATWSLDRWRANFPMSLDEEHGRVFIGCRNPARLVELDAASGRIVGDCEIDGDTDDLFFDPKRGRIYVSCGEGFLDTITVEDKGKPTRLARQATLPGARTCFFTPALDRLFLAVPTKAEVRCYRPMSQ